MCYNNASFVNNTFSDSLVQLLPEKSINATLCIFLLQSRKKNTWKYIFNFPLFSNDVSKNFFCIQAYTRTTWRRDRYKGQHKHYNYSLAEHKQNCSYLLYIYISKCIKWLSFPFSFGFNTCWIFTFLMVITFLVYHYNVRFECRCF